MELDTRIDSKFLKASVGFGGSCFQKDILNLVYLCRHFNLPKVADYWGQVIKLNDYQKQRFSKQIIDSLFNTVSGKKITFLGWAFKKDTNDTRESAAIYVAWQLLQDKAEIHVYDPKVRKEQMLKDLLRHCEDEGRSNLTLDNQVFAYNDPYAAMHSAHAIALLTEWDEFKTYDWQAIYNNMLKPAFLFDGRNILDIVKLSKVGFEIKSIGKS